MNLLLKTVAAGARQIPPTGLVGLYWFDEAEGQILTDCSTAERNGQLGSAAGADLADPTWTAQGLQFGGDDYVKLPYSVDAEADFTVFICADVAGSNPAVNQTYFSLGNHSDGTQYAHVVRTTSGTLQVSLKNDAAALVSGAISAADVRAGVRLLKFRRKNDLFHVKDVSSGKKSTDASAPAAPMTFDQMALGARLRDTADAYLGQQIYAAAIYARATTDKEDMQVYGAMRAELALRGVTLT